MLIFDQVAIPRKPRTPPGVRIDDKGVHFPPIVFPPPPPPDELTYAGIEKWEAGVDQAYAAWRAKYEPWARAYEAWFLAKHPEAKEMREEARLKRLKRKGAG